jgi:hypothetical protein
VTGASLLADVVCLVGAGVMLVVGGMGAYGHVVPGVTAGGLVCGGLFAVSSSIGAVGLLAGGDARLVATAHAFRIFAVASILEVIPS